jgi:hypothetical protein
MQTTLMRGSLPPVRWSAIASGVSLALALHVCLGLFGASLGFAAESANSRGLGILAALWALLSAFAASCIGAIFAVRLADASDERRALPHGILVWGIGLVIGVLFLSGTLAGSTLGASYIWNGGVIASSAGRDSGPGGAIDSAARDASGASLLGGFACLAGLGGALLGAMLGRDAVGARADERVRSDIPAPRGGTYAPGLMPPPETERRREPEGDSVWSDPAFDRRRKTVADRRRH